MDGRSIAPFCAVFGEEDQMYMHLKNTVSTVSNIVDKRGVSKDLAAKTAGHRGAGIILALCYEPQPGVAESFCPAGMLLQCVLDEPHFSTAVDYRPLPFSAFKAHSLLLLLPLGKHKAAVTAILWVKLQSRRLRTAGS